MFGNRKARKPRIPVSKKDIKKAIAKANERLKSENEKIEVSISDAKTALKSTQSEVTQADSNLKDITSTIDSRISECTAIESQLFSLNSDLSSLTDKFKKELDIEESLRSSIDDLAKKESTLIKSIALLDSKKENTRSINADLKSAKEEYGQIKKDLLQSKYNAEEAKKDMSALRISRESLQNEYDKSAEKLGQLNAKVKNEIAAMELTLSEKQEYFQSETERIDRIIVDRIEELSDNTALANNKAKEYNMVLSKVILAENRITQAEEKAKEILKNNEDRIEQIKERFSSWKVVQLDQVAKLKLKGKIENIDKVGLKDILDG